MPLIASPQGFVRKGSVAWMLGEHVGIIRAGIQRIVVRSLETRGMRNPTDAEVQARIDFCLVTAAKLRRDLQWGYQRILDSLPEALEAHLDHRPWEPSKRKCWVPSDGM